MSPDDISAGDYVTVLRHHPRDRVEFGAGFTTTTVQHVDHSFCGDVLHVLAVDLPYVRVQLCSGIAGIMATLDLRRCELKRLTPEFVAASLPSNRSDR